MECLDFKRRVYLCYHRLRSINFWIFQVDRDKHEELRAGLVKIESARFILINGK